MGKLFVRKHTRQGKIYQGVGLLCEDGDPDSGDEGVTQLFPCLKQAEAAPQADGEGIQREKCDATTPLVTTPSQSQNKNSSQKDFLVKGSVPSQNPFCNPPEAACGADSESMQSPFEFRHTHDDEVFLDRSVRPVWMKMWRRLR